MFIYYIFLALVTVSVLHFLWKSSFIFSRDLLRNYSKTNVPFLKIGVFLLLQGAVGFFNFPRSIAQKYRRSVRSQMFTRKNFMIFKAADAEKILTSTDHHLAKGDMYNFLYSFVKTGLLTSVGDKWHARRRMLTPAFHFNILREYCEMLQEECDNLVELLRSTDGEAVDIIPISANFTLNALCESALGVKLSNLGDGGKAYRSSIYDIGKALIYRSFRPWLHIDFIYSLFGHEKEFNEIVRPVHELTQSIINKRRSDFSRKRSKQQEIGQDDDDSENIYMSSKKKRHAMMDTLLQAQTEGLIDDEGIIEETDTFMFAGHDTTSSAMTFTLFLLAHHPDVQQKVFEEVESVTGFKKSLTIDDLNRMNYLDRVLKESLRIYPPGHVIARTLTEDYEYEGEIIAKGTPVEIYIYDIHRDPEYFPEPEKFDPDRFLPENSINRHNFAFIPFSAGMRNCIGQRFALLELKSMLCKVIANFRLEAVTKRENLVFMVDMVLRTNHPIEMKFVSRKN